MRDSSEHFVDFVYVDANEGSSSGGHVAVALGDRTYHFGHHAPGFLRLDRDDSGRFERVYGVLQNRNLHIVRVGVSQDTFVDLRASFNERYLSELIEFEVLRDLGRDRDFLAEWRAGAPSLAVRAAGYFRVDAKASSPTSRGGALRRLVERIEQRHGRAWLRDRRVAAGLALDEIAVELAQPLPSLASPGRHPGQGYGPARRAANARSWLEVVKILEGQVSLRSDAGRSIESVSLDEQVRRMLVTFADQFERALVELSISQRPDAGYAFLVGLARLLAIERSLEEGHLVILDVFPAGAAHFSAADIEARGGVIEDLTERSGREFTEVLGILSRKKRLREADYAALEGVANRYDELVHSRDPDRGLRASTGTLLPQRPRRLGIEMAARPDLSHLTQRERELQRLQSAQLARLERAHGYSLLAHNCVTELVDHLQQSVALEESDPTRWATVHLGGHFRPTRGLGFIPFVAARQVTSRYRVSDIIERPSYRRARVEKILVSQGVWGALRESNTLTSTVYDAHPEDSAFLFFTDGGLFWRPIFGAANFLYGLGTSVVGLGALPLDGGERLSAGLRGVAFSLPELAFINIRKGSFFFPPGDSVSARSVEAKEPFLH